MSADPAFSGDCLVKIIASDGKAQAFLEFYVSRDVTGIGRDLSEVFSIHVYPNPFNDYLQVELGGAPAYYEPVFLEVIDFSGRKLVTEVFDIPTFGLPGQRLDMTGLPGGVYILNVRTGTLEKSVLITKNN